MAGNPRGIAAAARGMAERPDMTSALAEIGCPTLVIVGQDDVISPPAEMRAIAQAIPGAKFVEIPAAGHMSPLENPRGRERGDCRVRVGIVDSTNPPAFSPGFNLRKEDFMDSPINRRFFLASTTQAAAAAALTPNLIDVRDHNAVGDGKTDDTAAIQKALDKAAETKATVHIPEGVFCCSTLKMPPNVGLVGNPTWDYRHQRRIGPAAGRQIGRALLDVTGAFGVRITGLCLEGARLGERHPRHPPEQAQLRQTRRHDLHRSLPHQQLHRRRHPPLPHLGVHHPALHGQP